MINLLPLYGISVTLVFTDKAEFTPFHNAAVDAFLRHMLNIGERYTQHFSIVCPENGRLYYEQDDHYRFAILCDASGLPELDTLISRLKRLPVTAVVRDRAVPLRDNLQLVEINDLTDGKPIASSASLTPFEYDRLSQLAMHYRPNIDQPVRLHWRFLAPTRLLRTEHKNLQGEARFIRDARELNAHLLIQRTLHSLHQLDPESLPYPTEWGSGAELSNIDIFWVDTPYYDRQGNTRTLGGLMGSFTLTLPPQTPLYLIECLLAAQYLGIGQRRTLGWGKYSLTLTETPEPTIYHPLTPHPVSRAESLLEQAFKPEILEITLLEMEQEIPNLLSDENIARLNSALGQIHAGDYHPPALQGIKLPKDDGSYRLLAVAPPWDRALQKSVATTLTPMLDAIYSTASFAYRKGHSRQQVRYEILQAWREGYRWVYESDIDDFFDAIDRRQLLRRLANVLGEDPLWRLIDQWLSRPVIVDGVRVERPKGIPQGSPLSPLLANFILDDFDADLQRHGFKLLRFADDFIILAKSRAQAEAAHQIVLNSLAELRLTINRDKTRIVSLEEGFKFLGYLFIKDTAIEIGGATKDGQDIFGPDDLPRSPPPWMVNLGKRIPQPIAPEDTPLHHLGDQSEQGSFLVLSGERHILTTDNNQLIIKDPDENLLYQLPWEQLYGILLVGLHHITLPAHHEALRQRVPIHLADRTGTYLGAITSSHPAQNSYKTWFLQLSACQREDFSLHIARELITARIHNQRTTLIRAAHNNTQRLDYGHTIRQLKQLLHKAHASQSIPQLMGYEGTATRAYLQSFNPQLPDWAQFDKRSKRPPQDPFNVLLSLGYTVLYSHIDAILQAHGLLTWKGCLHKQSPAHAALASDMMEPYRHLIETAAVNWARHQGKADDFAREEGQPGLRMRAEARRRYIRHLLQRLHRGIGGEKDFYHHFAAQTRLLKQAITRHVPNDFHAYRRK